MITYVPLIEAPKPESTSENASCGGARTAVELVRTAGAGMKKAKINYTSGFKVARDWEQLKRVKITRDGEMGRWGGRGRRKGKSWLEM